MSSVIAKSHQDHQVINPLCLAKRAFMNLSVVSRRSFCLQQ